MCSCAGSLAATPPLVAPRELRGGELGRRVLRCRKLTGLAVAGSSLLLPLGAACLSHRRSPCALTLWHVTPRRSEGPEREIGRNGKK